MILYSWILSQLFHFWWLTIHISDHHYKVLLRLLSVWNHAGFLPCSLVGNCPSQMASTVGSGMLPFLPFFVPHLLKCSQSIHMLPLAQFPLPFLRNASFCVPLFPPYQVQHNLVDSAFHKTFLDRFCPPWLFLFFWVSLTTPEILPAHWLFIYIYSISIDTL